MFEQVDASEGRLTTLLQENLTGIRVVRAFGQQEFEISRFHERNGELRDLEYRLFIALSNYWTLSDVLVFLQLGLTLIGGGYFVLQGEISDRHVGLLLVAGADDHLAGAADRPGAGRFGEGLGGDRSDSGDSGRAGGERGAGAGSAESVATSRSAS